MALTPDTDQFSQFLRLAFLRSPNYIAGVSGWTINQDGSVEFNNGTFRGNIVGGALYIYTGAPALGNPPQLAIVPSGTTQDPYGNAVTSSKILMQANVITMTSGIFRTAAAAPLIQLDGPHDALFVYDSAGNLTESLTPAATNDGIGHTVYAGIVNYNTALSAIVQMLGGTFNFGSPNQIALASGKQPGSVGLSSVTEGTAQVSTGLNGATDTAATLLLWSKNAGGAGQPFVQLQTVLEMFTPASLPAQQGDSIHYDSANAFPAMRPGTVLGDTIAYQVGQATFRNTTDQTNVTNTQVTITGLTGNALGAGLYRISGIVTVTNTSVGNATPTLGISGPALANVRVSIEAYSVTNNTFKGAGQITAQGTRFGMTSALAAGETGYFKFDGILNVSAAGAFNMTGGTTGAGTTMTYSAYSYVTYWPVN